MFPQELCILLSRLHSNSPKHSFQYTKFIIERDFGATIPEIFEQFNVEPIASGSIAQVYKAILNGRTVAVKVRSYVHFCYLIL